MLPPKTRTISLLGTLGVSLMSANAWSQNSSLFQRPDGMQSMVPSEPTPMNGSPIPTEQAVPALHSMNGAMSHPLQQASWTYTPIQTARKLKIHDIVSIRVDEATQSQAQGNASSRKNTIYDARLSDWVRLDGIGIKTAPMTSGDPRVAGQENEVYRADSTVRTRDSLTFNIAAEITDIRSNGTIVLSAQKTVKVNDNVFEASLSGLCRADDIGPDNQILSRNIFDLEVSKDDRGHVRDGYSRGWFTRLLARIKPF